MKLRHLLPISVRSCLFGNRTKFSRFPDPNDDDWNIWKEKSIIDFYENTQKRGIGNWVCNLAYPFLTNINFKEKSILEIGPGDIRHLNFFNSKPNMYTICDVEKRCLDMSKKKLDQAGIPNKTILLENSNSGQLPLSSEQFDFVIIDSAPVLVADDTTTLAPLVDTTLFVMRINATPARMATRALERLYSRQVNVGGVVSSLTMI